MDIAYSINERYVDYCLVSICSLLDNNKGADVNIHILYDNLPDESICRITDFVEKRNGRLLFHKIEESSVSGLILKSWPKSAWYRIFLPSILDSCIKRVLYLDSDTVVSGSISDLFDMDMTGCSLAGCVDVMTLDNSVFKRLDYSKESGYICSGVLLMNLDYFRKNDLTSQILGYARDHAEILRYPDQDAINYVCRDSKILLPLKYETMNSYFRNDEFVRLYHHDFKGMITDPRIIHYAGCPPWFIETNIHPYTSLFWRYAREIRGIKLQHFSRGMTIPKNMVKFMLGIFGMKKYSGHCRINLKRFAKNHQIDYTDS